MQLWYGAGDFAMSRFLSKQLVSYQLKDLETSFTSTFAGFANKGTSAEHDLMGVSWWDFLTLAVV